MESYDAFELMSGIHVHQSLLYYSTDHITPTIILVRVSMGLSFHDKSFMVEASIGSLRFAPDIANPTLENGIINQERRHDNSEIQLSDDSDIHLVDR